MEEVFKLYTIRGEFDMANFEIQKNLIVANRWPYKFAFFRVSNIQFVKLTCRQQFHDPAFITPIAMFMMNAIETENHPIVGNYPMVKMAGRRYGELERDRMEYPDLRIIYHSWSPITGWKDDAIIERFSVRHITAPSII